MTNTILILGANTLQIPLITKANELGYKTLVVSPIASEPGHKIATFSETCDVVDEEGVLSIAKRYDICGIITDQTDLPVRTMAYVASKMGLPGNDYDVACLFTDKYLMREKCKKIGVKTVEYKLCHSVEEAVEFFYSLQKDVIIKPIDNQGSKGVSKATTVDELKIKFKDALKRSRSNGVIVEEFIVGREFVVEGICVNYDFKTLCCGDTEYFDIPDVFSASKREFPSTASKELVNKIVATNNIIGKKFGLKQGLTHAEYIINGEDVILLEIAGRGGGVFISSDLIHIQTGIETEEFLLGIATGKTERIPQFVFQNKSCCYISFFLPEGKIIEISGVDDVVKLPYTHHHNFNTLCIDKEIKKNTDKTSRYFIILEAKNHEELMQRRNLIREKLHISVVNEKGEISDIIWE